MLFNSFAFLGFFAVVAGAFYVLPHRFRWLLLLAASLYFYAALNVGYLALLLGATAAAYAAGLILGTVVSPARRVLILALATTVELAALFVFKYFDFFAAATNGLFRTPLAPALGLLVPAGLSFYTFSCISYVADVYRRQLEPERHVGRFALYIAFFPKLLAGPIERATSFLPLLRAPTAFNATSVTEGLQLVLWGLFKKVVIADRLAVFVNAAYQAPEIASPVSLIVATYFFAFQIYCDFSGYTDIAIGTARVLGFDLMQNFRRPYLSTSVVEFWSTRWHISLSRWFRDYMYIPMGGSRVVRPRWYFNLFAVFLVSGLWHGASWTFVVWGGLNGLYVLAHLATASLRERIGTSVRAPRPLGVVLAGLWTFHLVLISWVFFRAASIDDAFTVLSRVWQSVPRLPSLVSSYAYSGELLLSVGLVALLLAFELLDERRPVWSSIGVRPVYVRWAAYYAVLAGLVVLGKWDLQKFVYMQF